DAEKKAADHQKQLQDAARWLNLMQANPKNPDHQKQLQDALRWLGAMQANQKLADDRLPQTWGALQGLQAAGVGDPKDLAQLKAKIEQARAELQAAEAKLRQYERAFQEQWTHRGKGGAATDTAEYLKQALKAIGARMDAKNATPEEKRRLEQERK